MVKQFVRDRGTERGMGVLFGAIPQRNNCRVASARTDELDFKQKSSLAALTHIKSSEPVPTHAHARAYWCKNP